jgi:hypothetical protein
LRRSMKYCQISTSLVIMRPVQTSQSSPSNVISDQHFSQSLRNCSQGIDEVESLFSTSTSLMIQSVITKKTEVGAYSRSNKWELMIYEQPEGRRVCGVTSNFPCLGFGSWILWLTCFPNLGSPAVLIVAWVGGSYFSEDTPCLGRVPNYSLRGEVYVCRLVGVRARSWTLPLSSSTGRGCQQFALLVWEDLILAVLP